MLLKAWSLALFIAFLDPSRLSQAEHFVYKYRGLPFEAHYGSYTQDMSVFGTLEFDAPTNRSLSLEFGVHHINHRDPHIITSGNVSNVVLTLSDGLRTLSSSTYGFGEFDPTRPRPGDGNGKDTRVSFATDENGVPISWSLAFFAPTPHESNQGYSTLGGWGTPSAGNTLVYEGTWPLIVHNGQPTQSIGATSYYAVGEHDPWHPPENLIVLTHGWQREGYLFGLPEIREALADRLAADGLQRTTKIIEFQWPESVTSSDPFAYFPARGKTDVAGKRLASEIQEFIRDVRTKQDPSYDPQIHFIGHSLGAMVNAEAVRRLIGISVEQFTILDSPFAPSNATIQWPFENINRHHDFFYDRLPFGSVEYVENLYASYDIRFSDTPRFGQPILGAGPGHSGLQVPHTDHSSIVTFYADLIRGEHTTAQWMHWGSPVLQSWQPGSQWKPAYSAAQLRALFWVRAELALSITAAHGHVVPGERIWRLITNSPAILSSDEVTISSNIGYVEFTIDPITDAGKASLRFSELLLWSASFAEIGDSETVLVPLDLLSGLTGRLEWQIDSYDEQAIAEIHSPVLYRVPTVPEPCSAALVVLCWMSMRTPRFRPLRRASRISAIG